jgi:hypothetical protein
VEVWDLGHKCTIDDVCDFVVKYIEADILGLLADRHLTIAGTEPFSVTLSVCSNRPGVDQSAVGGSTSAHRTCESDISETVGYPRSSLRDIGGTLLEVGRLRQEWKYVWTPPWNLSTPERVLL